MSKPSLKQIIALQTVLFKNLAVDTLDSDTLEAIIGSSEESGEQFTKFLQNGARLVIQDGKPVAPIAKPRIIEVDYSKSLKEMIAAGNYDNVDSRIHQFHMATGQVVIRWETKLFHFKDVEDTSTADKMICKEDEENYWQPVKIEHLLAYGAKFPNEQRKHDIVGIGSVYTKEFMSEYRPKDIISVVPVLSRNIVGRSLELLPCEAVGNLVGRGRWLLAISQIPSS